MTIATRKQKKADATIAKKIRRLKRGESLRVVDLFAGCGGLSLGFHSAGFDVRGAIEFDKTAAATHDQNFVHATEDVESGPVDITDTDPGDFIASRKLGRTTDDSVDVLIGGPPCQAFARVGRAKLREIDENPRAFKDDARGNLYLRFLHYVRELKPLALLIENVPDMMNYGGHNVAEEVSETLDGLGFTAGYTLLNSAYYGVPQMRERMYLIAYRKELGVEVTFPTPTNFISLPVGYKGSRDVALKALRSQGRSGRLFQDDSHYLTPPEPSVDLPPAVTAQDALSDLPKITKHLRGGLKKAPQRFDKLIKYGGDTENPYQQLMRNWPGFENETGVFDHVIRFLPRDYQIFAVMNPGDQYPQAYEHATRLFRDALEQAEANGTKLRSNSNAYKELKKSIVPPYDATKFPNKWRKMEADLPSRTLLAHIGKDTYTHIHYDSKQARTISVREAARLQSFPDGFRFAGAMNAALRQIGNAVPPLMAKAIATKIKDSLQDATT